MRMRLFIASAFLAIGHQASATAPCAVVTAGGNIVDCVPTMSVDPTGTYVAGGGGGSYNGPLASQLPASLGPKTSANSLSVTPATDAAFNTIGDGLADGTTCTGSATAVGAPSSQAGPAATCYASAVLTNGASGAYLQVSANASGNTLQFEGSNDSTTGSDGTWSPILGRGIGVNIFSGSGGFATNTSTAGTIYQMNGIPKWVRWRITTYVGGTTTVTWALKRVASANTVDAVVNISAGIVSNAPNSGAIVALSQCFGAAVSSFQCGSAAAHNFYLAEVYATADTWVYVFNATSAPSNGAVTFGAATGNYSRCVKVPTGTSGSFGGIDMPTNYTAGIYIALSSTACGTLTLATTGYVTGFYK